MHACILREKGEDAVNVQDYLKTLQSLEKHGFTTISLERCSPDHDLLLYPGEIVDSINEKETVLKFGEIKIVDKNRGSMKASITTSSKTPKPLTFVQLTSDDLGTLKNLADNYPETLEPLYRIGQWYLARKEFGQAFYHFQQARLYLNKFNGALGWVEAWHKYGLDFESVLAAYYTGNLDIGRVYADKLLVNRDVPHNLLNRCYMNYEFYAKPIEVKWSKEYVVADMSLLEEGVPEEIKEYKSLNPSLLRKDDDSFYLNIRIVNWRVNPVGFNQYFSPHPKNKFKTKNLLAVIANDGEYVERPRLVAKGSVDLKKIRGHHIDGFEDCRLFHHEGNTLRFITNYTKNNPQGAMRLSIGTIDIEKTEYTSLIPVTGHGDNLTQKNWLIYDVEDGIAKAIYHYEPFTLVTIDLSTGIVTALAEAKLPIRGGEFRGSAGPVPFDDGYLIVIHQVFLKEHGGRRYFHRFIQLDKDYLPIGMSEAWYLQSQDIEYVSTMVALKDEILIGYGLCDRCACISSIPNDIIRRMIVPINKYT